MGKTFRASDSKKAKTSKKPKASKIEQLVAGLPHKPGKRISK